MAGTILFLTFVAATMAIGGWQLAQSARTWRWTRVPGEVLSSDVAVETDAGGEVQYRPRIRYRYVVAGRTYDGDVYGWPTGAVVIEGTRSYSTWAGRSEVESIVNRYTAGNACDVWYDPRDPHRAVLFRGINYSALIWLVVPALGLAIGALLAWLWR